MADQRFRSQQRDPGLSPASNSGAKGRFSPRGEDPLAELARLIGQDDPFTDFRNDPRGAPSPSGNAHAPRNGNGRDRHSEQDQDYDERDAYDREPQAPARARRHAEEDLRQPDVNAPRKNGRGAYAYGGGRDEASHWRLPPEPAAGREPNASRALPPQPAKRPARQSDYAQEPEDDYDDPRYARSARAGNGYADPRQAYDSPYDREDEAAGEPEYEEDRYAGEYDEQAYADPATSRRRWLYAGIVATIGLLVVGGTGVYAYRVLFGKYSGGAAPTIRPADLPNKVPPQTAQAGDGGQKLIYDRLDGQKPVERIVSREEKPADVAQNAGRVVTAPPPSTGPVTAFAPIPTNTQNAPAAITGASPIGTMPAGEPRKVRTTTVRADGTIVDTPRPMQQTAAQRPVQGQPQPLALNPYSQPPQADPDPDAQTPIGAQPARTAALAQPPSRTTQPTSQQAWGGVQQPTATAPTPQQTSNYVPAGSYVVQVASQKTEADARTSLQQLQAKYSNVFGNYQANIKRVDLGDRGTFYRAMLGPFSNRDQAYEMCQNLKAAGGECIVQRN
jgi:cell division septation protein DedD